MHFIFRKGYVLIITIFIRWRPCRSVAIDGYWSIGTTVNFFWPDLIFSVTNAT